MMRASEQVPRWLMERDRAGSYQDAGTWMTIFILLWASIYLVNVWIYDPLEWGSLPFLLGASLCTGASLALHRRWRRETGKRSEADLRAVHEREEVLEARLREMLEGGA